MIIGKPLGDHLFDLVAVMVLETMGTSTWAAVPPSLVVQWNFKWFFARTDFFVPIIKNSLVDARGIERRVEFLMLSSV